MFTDSISVKGCHGVENIELAERLLSVVNGILVLAAKLNYHRCYNGLLLQSQTILTKIGIYLILAR